MSQHLWRPRLRDGRAARRGGRQARRIRSAGPRTSRSDIMSGRVVGAVAGGGSGRRKVGSMAGWVEVGEKWREGQRMCVRGRQRCRSFQVMGSEKAAGSTEMQAAWVLLGEARPASRGGEGCRSMRTSTSEMGEELDGTREIIGVPVYPLRLGPGKWGRGSAQRDRGSDERAVKPRR